MENKHTTIMTPLEYHAIDTENAVLRNRLKDVKGATASLCSAVERYLRQDCLRSELCATLAATKRLMK